MREKKGEITDTVRVGRTISQEWERQESESERFAARKKQKQLKVVKLLLIIAVLGVIVAIVVFEISGWLDRREKVEAARNTPQPTVSVIDEDNSGVTARMKEYVAVLEQDFADLSYKVNRAVVPSGKNREIHVFLDGYDFYIKFNIDRGTAVSAEDADRMIRYVKEKNITPQYIDVRIEGKGYYK